MTVGIDPVLESLDSTEFEYAEQDLRAAAALGYRIGKTSRLGEGRTISYTDLVRGVSFQLVNVNGGHPFVITDWSSSLNRRIIGDFLGYLSKQTYKQAQFFASVVAVHVEGDLRPGRQFFDLVHRVGALPDLSDDAKERFWIEQLRRAHHWYVNHPPDQIPGVEKDADICDGTARIAGTRIPVWALEGLRRQGASQTDVVAAYPHLRREDLYHGWLYAQAQPEEIDLDIRRNEEP